jgi:methyl-accepting chemotaxis protein
VISSLDTSTQTAADSSRAVAQLTGLAEDLLQSVRAFKIAGHEMVILDLAKNDHRLFVNKVRSALSNPGSLESAQLADHHNCRFGKWYDTDGKTICGHLPSFRAIDTPHERIHTLTKEAITAATGGNDRKARQLYDEVEKLSHVVINSLAEIRQEFVQKQHIIGQLTH